MFDTFNTSLYGNKRISVVRLVIQETGTYNRQFRRSFVSSVDGQSVKSLVDMAEQTRTIAASTIASLGLPFVQPSSTPEGEAPIVNGWEEKRFRFFMELRIEDQLGSIKNEYLVGYTDYKGISHGGHLDNQMRFFVNAVNITRSAVRTTALGTQTVSSVIDNSQILANTNYSGIHSQNQLYGMRPDDIFNRIEHADISAFSGESFVNTSLFLSRKPTKNKRLNTSPSNFVASLLESYRGAQNSEAGYGNANVYETAKRSVSSQPIAQDPFLSYVQNQGELGNSFTLGTLRELDPNVNNVIAVSHLSLDRLASLHNAGSTCDWGGSDINTVIATTLAQSVPAYMLENFINDVSFMATNQGFGSDMVVTVMDANSFMMNTALSVHIEAFKFKLINELFKSITYNNQIGIDIKFKCDLLDEIWISVSINGGPEYVYVAPAFADSLFSPNYTWNQNTVSAMATDFNALFSQLSEISDSTVSGFGNV